MARPTKFPEWAKNDITDPISGGPNKVEPPQQKKDDGYFYKEKPPAPYDNYWRDLTDNWLKYLDEERRLLPYAVAEEDTPNNYDIDFTGIFSAFDNQMFFRCTFNQPNTGAVFITVTPIVGAKEIISNATGVSLTGGEILPNREYILAYNVATTKLHILNNLKASETIPGIIQTASLVETIASAIGTKALVPNHTAEVIQRNLWGEAVISGAANVYTGSTTPSFTPTYGSVISLDMSGTTNTGASTLAINGETLVPLVTHDRSPLIGGEFKTARYYLAVRLGSEWVLLSNYFPASKTVMELAASNNFMMTPGNAIWHPGVAKAWVKWTQVDDSTVSVLSYHNVTSVIPNGKADVTINLDVTFVNTDKMIITGNGGGTGIQRVILTAISNTITTTSVQIRSNDESGTAVNRTGQSISIFGELA